MAGGAYKGLTIRIGADTTKLSSALRGIDSAAFKTQKELRSLENAAKLDPKNTVLTTRQIGALANQATVAAAKASLLRKSVAEVGEQKTTLNPSKTIKELAKETDNAALAAAQATNYYNSLNAQIEPLFKEVKKATGVDLREATNIGEFDEWFALVKDSGEVSQETITKIEKLKGAWTDAFNNMEDIKLVESFQNAQTSIQTTEAELRHAARAMAELNKSSEFSKQFDGMTSEMTLLGAAAEAASDKLRGIEEAAKLDPKNVDLFHEKTLALGDAIQVAQRQSELLNEKLAAYKTEGYDKKASELGNVAEAVQRTKDAYAEASEELAKYSQRRQQAEDDLKRLMSSDDGTAESRANIENAEKSLQDLTARYEEARKKAAEASSAYDGAKACSEFEKTSAEALKTDTVLGRLRESFGGLRMSSGISLQVGTLAKDLQTISAGADTAKSRFDILNKAVQIRPHNLNIAVERLHAMREAVNAANEKAANLRQQLERYKAEGIDKIAEKTDDAAVAFEKANAKVQELEKKLASLKHPLGEDKDEAQRLGEELKRAVNEANTAAAVNEYKELQAQLRNVETEAKEMKDSLKTGLGEVGSAAVIAAQQVGQLAVQAGRSIVQASDEIDSSYRDLRKTFDATEGEYKKLYDAAMEYSQANVTSADKMLEMEAIAAQLGVGLEGGADAIQKFAEVAANLDVATDIDSDTIALQMGQIQNVMSDLNPDNINKFGDALVRLGNNMPTQESNIMQITQRLSAIGDVAHFSTPELMGWAAAIASTGQKSEAAASGIATTITKISAAVSKGGEAVEGFAEVADMSAEKFIEQWRTAPSETLEKFVNGLKKSGDEVFATLMDLDITGVRQNQTLASLAQTVGTVDNAVRMANEAFEEGGDAAREADKKAQGFSGTLAKLKNSVQVLAGSFGERLVPYMKGALEAIQRLTNWIQNLDDKTLDMTVKVGGAMAVLTTVAPTVMAIGGALSKLASGALTAVVNGIAMLVGAGTIGSIGDFFAAISLGAEAAGGAIKAFLIAGGGIPVIIGGVAAAATALAFIDWKKAQDEAAEFNDTLRGISGTIEGIHKDFLFGASDIDSYAEAWQAAGADMDEFYEKMSGHIEAMNDMRGEATDTVGSLERYRDIIDNAIGAGKDWGGNISELQWALDGLAEITGETYTAEDILAGKFGDEVGKADELRDAINKLIDAKKKQSELDALTNMRTEAVQGQMEAKEAFDDAAEAYKNYRDIVMEGHGFTTGAQLTNYLETSTNHDAEWLRGLEEEWSKAKQVYDEWGEKIVQIDREYDSVYDRSAYMDSDAFGAREGIIQTSEAMKEALVTFQLFNEEGLDVGIKALAQSIEDAGVSVEQFAGISEQKFAELAEKSGGDIERFVQLLAETAGVDPVEVDVDANTEKAREAFASTKSDIESEEIEANVKPNVSDVDTAVAESKAAVEENPAEQEIKGDNDEAIEAVHEVGEAAESEDATVTIKAVQEQTEAPQDTESSAKVNVTVSGTEQITKLEKAISKIPKSTKITLATSADAKKVNALHSALTKTAKPWRATLAVNVNGDSAVYSILRTLHAENGRRYDSYFTIHERRVKTVEGSNARGGYMPHKIPRHADGFIATRATLTDYGWIGEDGAEAYSGGSLVPLTNRKYSQPYIDDISDAVAKKLGPVGQGNNITVTVTGVTSPDEVASAIARKLSILDL